MDLPADAAEAAELWIETASGAVYDLEWRSGELVVAHAASELRVGAAVLHDESVDEVTPVAPVSEIRYWRDSKRPWPEIDARVATPLQRSIDGSYGAHLLAGEALWFEARGGGYDYCAVEDLGPGRSAFGEEPLPCPLLPPGRSVDGRVIDEDGAAVAGAEIYLGWSQQRSYKRDFTVVAGEESARRSNLLLLLRSHEGGRFYSDRMGGKPPRTSFPFGGFVGIGVKRPGYLPISPWNIDGYRTEDDQVTALGP